MERLDIVDENGNPTGETVEREMAHSQGIRHRTAHVWILRKVKPEADNKKFGNEISGDEISGDESWGNKDLATVEILLQKRSNTKDSHPGCYDISSAGHIPAGIDFIPSALRELQEELGITAKAEELHFCGQRQIDSDNVFHGKPFKDRQVSNVYALWKNVDIAKLTLQEAEVSDVIWMNFQKCLLAVQKNTIKHCIVLEELQMLEREIENRKWEKDE